MRNINRSSLIVMLVMSSLSLTSLVGLNASAIAIAIGIIYFFTNKKLTRLTARDSGLDIRSLKSNLKDKEIWVWIAMPLIMNLIRFLLSKRFLPEYLEYETLRAGAYVSIELSLSTIILFLIFALGEEIAWRAFFQQQLNHVVPVQTAVILSSLLFTVGHFATGNIIVVLYGLLFIFINSVLYGIIYYKTKNAWISTIAHFLANVFEMLLVLSI